MAKDKQHVFSARTTEEGLKALNAKKAELGINWDSLVIDAVNAHYGMEVPKPPKAERKPKAEKKPKARKPAKAEKKAKAKKAGKPKAAKTEAGEVKVYKGSKLVRTETAEGKTVSVVQTGV